jgi:RNA polymerase sigma-70 factor (ECF subfamily)
LAYRSEPDNQVFEELVHRYEKELYGYLRHYLGDAEAAADVFQQTFLQVHLKCEQFEPGRKVRPWLYTVATNLAIDCQRRVRRQRTGSLDRLVRGNDDENEAGSLVDLMKSDDPGPQADAESAEQHESLRQAVDALPETCREVLLFVYFLLLIYS